MPVASSTTASKLPTPSSSVTLNTQAGCKLPRRPNHTILPAISSAVVPRLKRMEPSLLGIRRLTTGSKPSANFGFTARTAAFTDAAALSIAGGGNCGALNSKPPAFNTCPSELMLTDQAAL